MHKEALFGHCLPLGARLAMVGIGVDGQTTAGQEFAPDLDVFGVQQLNQILHNDVHAILVKIAVITEAKEIELQGFAFHQAFVGNVGNIDGGEIRLARHGAETGELGTIEFDKIIITGMLIGKALQNLRRIIAFIGSFVA